MKIFHCDFLFSLSNSNRMIFSPTANNYNSNPVFDFHSIGILFIAFCPLHTSVCVCVCVCVCVELVCVRVRVRAFECVLQTCIDSDPARQRLATQWRPQKLSLLLGKWKFNMWARHNGLPVQKRKFIPAPYISMMVIFHVNYIAPPRNGGGGLPVNHSVGS